MSPAANAREQRVGSGAAGRAPASLARLDDWLSRDAADGYSRRVALLRRVLPALGLGLLLLVGVWPRLEPLLESVRFTFPTIDHRDARELRMIDPRYAGIDRYNRPYVLTAAAGVQMPGHNDLMSLDRPRGQIIAHGGATVVLTAAEGIYQAQPRLLDLFGKVTLTHSNGTRFVTRAAHLDLARETADGHDPVSGKGPSGAITAEGFRIEDKGDTIFFTGRAHLLLLRLSARQAARPPPTLPAAVERKAARLNAAGLDMRRQGTIATLPAPAESHTASGRAASGPPASEPAGAAMQKPPGPGAGVSGMRHRAD